MNFKKALFFGVLFLGSIFVSIYVFLRNPEFLLSKEMEADIVSFPERNLSIKFEAARNPYEWSKGLMFRDSLGEGAGMLFIFPQEEKRSFWMKNVSFPLDLVFISKNKRVVDIKENFSPCLETLVCESYVSKEPAMYVLEVNSGVVKENGIQIGEKLEF